MSFVKQANANTAATILAGLKKRNMEGWFCETCEEAVQKALELMPEGSVLSWGGSMSIQECGLMDAVKARSYTLIDRAAATTPEEKRELYAKAVLADYYLMSTNAITADGELVNIDGLGNRVACLSYGPDKVIVLASIDKMCTDVDEAVRRVHLVAAPPNALRVKADTPCARTGVCADCLSPDCICCQTLITRKSRIPGRITVVLTGEHLGF